MGSQVCWSRSRAGVRIAGLAAHGRGSAGCGLRAASTVHSVSTTLTQRRGSLMPCAYVSVCLCIRRIIFTVAPRYKPQYRTAAENALHHCYRNAFTLLKVRPAAAPYSALCYHHGGLVVPSRCIFIYLVCCAFSRLCRSKGSHRLPTHPFSRRRVIRKRTPRTSLSVRTVAPS